MQIQISWLLQKPTDLDLHCLQRQCRSGFSRTRVKDTYLQLVSCWANKIVSLSKTSLTISVPYFRLQLSSAISIRNKSIFKIQRLYDNDDLVFTSLSTLFKSYWDNGRMMMNRFVQWSTVQSWAELCLQQDSNPWPCDHSIIRMLRRRLDVLLGRLIVSYLIWVYNV